MRQVDGSWSRRFDLYFRAFKLVIEYDGEQHSLTWKADARRREEIDKLGWRIIVVHREGIYQDPRETLDRISVAAPRAWRAAGAAFLQGRVRPLLPRPGQHGRGRDTLARGRRVPRSDNDRVSRLIPSPFGRHGLKTSKGTRAVRNAAAGPRVGGRAGRRPGRGPDQWRPVRVSVYAPGRSSSGGTPAAGLRPGRTGSRVARVIAPPRSKPTRWPRCGPSAISGV